jgi:hypothetical protein
MDAGVYDESYNRVLAVLRSVGAVIEEVEETGKRQIAEKLIDQDICLSMVDKINMKKGRSQASIKKPKAEEPTEANGEESPKADSNQDDNNDNVSSTKEEKKTKKKGLKFWAKGQEKSPGASESTDNSGNVILSAAEPSMTRQLNALSNIVQRALLFGGDQELLVLAETLSGNRAPFVERWYPGTGEPKEMFDEESRPGVQYMNALILLLKEAYEAGVVETLDPFTKLTPSYANAYERLTATLVELGSGYLRPTIEKSLSGIKPKTAQEELGRFAVWEANFRSKSDGASSEISAYPEDLEGEWEVRDEVGGEIIGNSTVVFQAEGDVVVAPPLQGLRWRLDPGPTHLDTCTFQVLAEDGTVLQYRGFIDRGARLEARFSKRSIKIRGSVMFQMRDGDTATLSEDYYRDVLPVNYKTGTTKFVMRKVIEGR